MGVRAGVCAIVLAAGCRAPAPVPARPVPPPRVPLRAELPFVPPVPANPDLRSLPKPAPAPVPSAYRGLTEPVCVELAAANASAANMLDDENAVPCGESPSTRLRREVRYFAALELRNKAAGEALERFYQLADIEARSALVRESFPILDELHDRASRAKSQSVRHPFDPADLERQRSQVASQLEQAEAGGRVLNIDLKHRLYLPTDAPGEALWPTGDFGIDPTPVDAEAAAASALANRAELRGLRALHAGLNAETLDDARDLLRAANPLLGARGITGMVARKVARQMTPDPAALAAEVAVRRKQIAELLVERERVVADETRAAAVSLNSQTTRVSLARDRADSWKAKWDDAVKQKEAAMPNAELNEFQVRLEWLKARSEVVAEVMAWHQARARLTAARGGFTPETAPAGVVPAGLPPPVVPWVPAR